MLAGNVCRLFAVLITMKMAAVARLVGILVIFLQVAICQREIFSFVRRALKRLMAETSLCIWTHYQVSSVNQLNRRTADGPNKFVHKRAYMQSIYMLDQHCSSSTWWTHSMCENTFKRWHQLILWMLCTGECKNGQGYTPSDLFWKVVYHGFVKKL